MRKLIRKEYFAAEIIEQLRQLPSARRDQIMDRGVLACELGWQTEKELDAGKLIPKLIEADHSTTSNFRGQTGPFGLFKSRQMEKVLAGLIEQAWLHCLVHNLSAREDGIPNRISVRFRGRS